ncbi:DUF3888 domain-containing protein [Clostridium sp. 19966]|uniref:DUF3888 domain-containing protein n=1 Tax=Clostridium sp. 19966 TaxID=2768166 RepID=UPI0028DF5355|nr:DUF3888 domain-containing protein [Clostridium sp. 19966]MDT8715891.1 DUF3888 domain-containing protein [Clostridium sp. 19966]
MKKKIIYSLLFFLCFLIFVQQPIVINAKPENDKNFKALDLFANPTEETYKDMLMLLLLPHITNAVEKQYGKFYSVDPSAIKVLELVRPLGYKTNIFNIKLRVAPYIGPHDAIGLDDITLKIEPEKITLLKFQHIKSYKIPEHLQ